MNTTTLPAVKAPCNIQVVSRCPLAVEAMRLAVIAVIVTAAARLLLIPVLGNRFGFDFFLISTFVCSRYLGLGPSVFALFVGGFSRDAFSFCWS